MMRKAIGRWSFRTKCLVICLFVGIIPVIFMGAFSYMEMKRTLEEQERQRMRATLAQEGALLNFQVERLVQSSHYLCWNNNLNKALSRDYQYTSEMYLFYRDTMEPLLSTTRVLNPEVTEITVYTDTKIFFRTGKLRPLSDVTDEVWYSAVCGDYLDHWILRPETEEASLITQVYGMTEGYRALVRIDLSYNMLTASLRNLFDSGCVIRLLDREGTELFRYDTPDMEDAGEEALSDGNIPLSQKYVTEAVSGIGDGWTIQLIRPMETLLKPGRRILHLLVLIVLASIFLVFISSSFLSAGIVRPLEKLSRKIGETEAGIAAEYAVETPAESAQAEKKAKRRTRTEGTAKTQDKNALFQGGGDEIAALNQAYDQMVKRLNELIGEIVQERERQKDYEMQALMAQINPHFLYNSLSLINSRAILNGQKEIGETARFLSAFYRTTLNNGKSMTLVRHEIENITAYINLQRMMHDKPFTVRYEIDEAICDAEMPKLLLQPLAENAVLHGIDGKEDAGEGLLVIRGFEKDGTLIFQVYDNGPGIPEDKRRSLLTEETGGYGVRNVHERVRLLYGEPFGLSYDCGENGGTCATLSLPRKEAEHDKNAEGRQNGTGNTGERVCDSE